jgi:hypothetical protein
MNLDPIGYSVQTYSGPAKLFSQKLYHIFNACQAVQMFSTANGMPLATIMPKLISCQTFIFFPIKNN